jgi:hypothetical protein
MGDAIGAGIVYHMSKAELEELDRREAGTNVIKLFLSAITNFRNKLDCLYLQVFPA